MSTLTRNLASSLAERVVTTVLTILVVPLQVRFLGIEAYGILGFAASLQVLFNILDLGLGPTVIRELATDRTRSRPETRSLIQTLSTIYWAVALILGCVLAAGAPWLAMRWLTVGQVPPETVVLAIRLVAATIFLRWPVALYAGMLSGAQRLDVVNAIRMTASVSRLVGGLVVVIIFRSVSAYLWAVVAVGALEVVAYALFCALFLPNLPLSFGFSRHAIGRVWRFSTHMNLISVLSAVLVQGDRLVISRMLPIAELGFYSIAYSAAVGLSMLQSVVTAALFPALAEQLTIAPRDAVERRCQISVQLLMYGVSGFAGLLMFFGQEVLSVWISPAAAERAAGPLSILAVGFMLNAAVSVPQTLAVATGRTFVTMMANITAVVLYLPALVLLVRGWGIDGAPWAWVALNACYIAILVPLLQRRIPMEPVVPWLARNVLPFMVCGVGTFGASALIAKAIRPDSRLVLLVAAVVASAAYSCIGFWLGDRSARERVVLWRSLTRELTGTSLS